MSSTGTDADFLCKESLQLRVLRLGLLEDGDVRVCFFPRSEKILVGFTAFLTIPSRGIGTRKIEFRQWSKHFPVLPSAMSQQFLELGGSLIVFSRGQVGFRPMWCYSSPARDTAPTHFSRTGP